MTLLLFALLLGLDNMTVSAGLGGLQLQPRRRIWLVTAFALAEGLLPLIGLWLGAEFVPEWIGSWILLLAGLLVLTGCLWGDRLLALVTSPAALVVLPLALGLDNLAAGTAFGSMGLPIALSALLLGGVSAAACWLGLAFGKFVGDRFTTAGPWLSGCWLLALSLNSFMGS